jgi:hypothetical protein
MTSSSVKILNLPKLKDDGSNWVTYKERILNTLTHKGLKRYVVGSAKQPIESELRDDGEYYMPKGMKALTDDELEALEKKLDDFSQKEASVREVIYDTVSRTTFLQIKNELTSAAVWKSLALIFEDKGELTQLDTLTKLQGLVCLETTDMRDHIADMSEIKEELAGMGAPVPDAQFTAMIRKSLPPSYRSLLRSIGTATRVTGKPLTSTQLIQCIHEEADSQTVEKNADKVAENAAMLASKGGKGNRKGKREVDKSKTCANPNCLRVGHLARDCYQKGGGKEGQAPWDKKKDSTSKANIASMDDADENVALVITVSLDDETALVISPKSPPIIIDCGASRHFSSDRGRFLSFTEIAPQPIKSADGRAMQATGRGDMKLLLPMGDNCKPTLVTLTNVYYSPQMAYTLISVSQMDQKGHSVHIEDKTCTISTPKPSSRIIGRIPLLRGLYRVDIDQPMGPSNLIANVASNLVTISQLHRLMGHINHDDLRKMVRDGHVTGIELDMNSKPEFCPTCIKAKAPRKPFPKASLKTGITEYGSKVSADVWGPAQVQSLGGSKYSLCYIDLHTHEEKVHFLKKKSEAFNSYKRYEAWVKVQRNAFIKIFGSDRGGEFTSKEFNEHLANAGTVRHLTVHDSPQSNGGPERGNRTHLDLARALLDDSGLPKDLWAEAVRHGVWLRNRVPTRAVPTGKTPFEMGTGERPDLSNLHQFGCTAWVKNLKAGKLDPRTVEGRFLGIDEESKGYRIYWPQKRSVSVERDVYFNKDEALLPETTQIEEERTTLSNQHVSATRTALNPSDTTSDTSMDDVEPERQRTPSVRAQNVENRFDNAPDIPQIPFPTSNEPPIPKPTAPHERRIRSDGLIEPEPNTGRGFRPRKATGFYKNPGRTAGSVEMTETAEIAAVIEADGLDPGGMYVDEDWEIVEGYEEFVGTVEEFAMVTGTEPETIRDALSRADESDQWRDAIKAEITQCEELDTWEIVEAPHNANIVANRYVFRYKRDSDGKVVKFKVRLVAKGFTQVYGLDFFETRVWIVRWETLRNLLAAAGTKNAVIHQADVKNAYLNAEMREDIYMALPPNYDEYTTLGPISSSFHHPVCKLKKGLYGTKQAGRGWYMKLRDTFLSLGYSVSTSDLAVFFKYSGNKYTIVAAATDDFTIIGDSLPSVTLIKKQLDEHFEIVDLGEINWLLGVHITRDLELGTVSFGQQAYIDLIVERMGLDDARPITTPMEAGIDLTPGSSSVSPTDLSNHEKSKYREAIGSLMYCATVTRPDISYAVSTLSRYMEQPNITQWRAVQRVFRYLKGTRDLRLVLGGREPTLVGYSDSDFASQLHRHSISGFAFYAGQGVVSWSSKKQPIVTLSSTEAEYVALTHAAKDAIWHRKLHSELPFLFPSVQTATTLFCDNQGAIVISKDPAFHMRTKHIDTRFHFIRETINQGHLHIPYCPTDDMIADIFTKALARFKFERFRTLLGLEYPRSA